MQANLEQLSQCHFLFMKWMRKTDAHLQQLLIEFDSDHKCPFPINTSKRNLVTLIQVDAKRHRLWSYCSWDYETRFIIVYEFSIFIHQWERWCKAQLCQYLVATLSQKIMFFLCWNSSLLQTAMLFGTNLENSADSVARLIRIKKGTKKARIPWIVSNGYWCMLITDEWCKKGTHRQKLSYACCRICLLSKTILSENY